MANAKKLKVFRTPIGFHDAYVAAPSMKAALEAWGSSTNLFSQGAAELVTDPKLTRAPLARPGEVVRVTRGSEGEHFKALGRTKKTKKAQKVEGGSRIKSGMTKKTKRGRRPSSAAVERAEAALAKAEARHREALEKLRAEAAAIDKRRRELERKQREERQKLTGELDEAREKFRSAMEEWAG